MVKALIDRPFPIFSFVHSTPHARCNMHSTAYSGHDKQLQVLRRVVSSSSPEGILVRQMFLLYRLTFSIGEERVISQNSLCASLRQANTWIFFLHFWVDFGRYNSTLIDWPHWKQWALFSLNVSLCSLRWKLCPGLKSNIVCLVLHIWQGCLKFSYSFIFHSGL